VYNWHEGIVAVLDERMERMGREMKAAHTLGPRAIKQH